MASTWDFDGCQVSAACALVMMKKIPAIAKLARMTSSHPRRRKMIQKKSADVQTNPCAGFPGKRTGNWNPVAWTLLIGWSRSLAVLVEQRFQLVGDVDGFAMLDVASLHHVDQLTILHNSDGGRRGRIPREIGAGALGRIFILAGKNAEHLVGPHRVLECQANCGAHATGGTSANRIHDNHDGTGLMGNQAVDFRGCA